MMSFRSRCGSGFGPFVAVWSLTAVLVFAAGPLRGQALSIVDPGQGPVGLTGGPGGLSGLTHAPGRGVGGAARFYFVGDSNGQGGFADVAIDGATGGVASPPVAIAGTHAYTGGVDLEAIAYDPSDGRVLVADESGPAIRKHPAGGGAATLHVTLPAIYSQARANRSLESLARGPGGGLWTANEEALTPDGPAGPGSLVRLQRFDASLNPAGQWAYRTGGVEPTWGVTQNSGLVDLAVAPDGSLLALERAVGAVATGLTTAAYRLRSRVYRIDLTAATDVSGESSLATPTAAITEAGKTLLWEGFFNDRNFEGLAVGPPLDDAGVYGLLLVSDDDPLPAASVSAAGLFTVTIPHTPMEQSLYPLKLTGLPEPGSAAVVAAGLAGLAWRRRAGSDR